MVTQARPLPLPARLETSSTSSESPPRRAIDKRELIQCLIGAGDELRRLLDAKLPPKELVPALQALVARLAPFRRERS
jgi:hypothetical protein